MLEAAPSANLKGTIKVPGDKSISHRAIMLGGLSVGHTHITGLLEGEDVLATAAALSAMGATVTKQDDGSWIVDGVGLGGLREPDDILDMGNSGTAARLLMGVLAGQKMTCFMTGDASLRSRPMMRVATPLESMGATFTSRDGMRLPLCLIGTDTPLAIEYKLPVASAQVKSAILLAGLSAIGKTTVIEDKPTRDHTERMLTHFGGEIEVIPLDTGGNRITVTGQPELSAADLIVPADPSSAAFPTVAALITKNSSITLTGVGQNETRTGLYTTLIEMGADITFENERIEGGEPIADIIIKSSDLKGVDVPSGRAPSQIDEYPILAIAAAFAAGKTTLHGIGELRVKECDRLSAVVAGLRANGVEVEEGADWMIIHGTNANVPGGGMVKTHIDHRIAMSFLVMGLAAQKSVKIDDASPIDTSFPNFKELMTSLGSNFRN